MIGCDQYTGLRLHLCEGRVPDGMGGFRDLLPSEATRYRALFAGQQVPVRRAKKKRDQRVLSAMAKEATVDIIGAGSMLHANLDSLGIREMPGCGCKAKAKQMDQLGLRWCEQNLDELAGWLVTNAQKRADDVSKIAGFATSLATRGLASVAKALISKSINDVRGVIRERIRNNPLDITVAVTTSPRLGPHLLPRCVDSLIASGFTDITVYAEPESDLTGVEVPTVIRQSKFGAWQHWMQTLEDCLAKSPDVIMIVQDDSVFASGVRDLLSASLWPSYDTSAIQLCCSSYYTRTTQGFSGGLNKMPGTGMVGAWATVMHRYWAEQILSYGRTYGWRGHHKKTQPDPVLKKAIDDYIGYASEKLGGTCYICYPSVVLHDADYSTLNHGNSKGVSNNRHTSDFIGQSIPATEKVPIPKEIVQFR